MFRSMLEHSFYWEFNDPIGTVQKSSFINFIQEKNREQHRSNHWLLNKRFLLHWVLVFSAHPRVVCPVRLCIFLFCWSPQRKNEFPCDCYTRSCSVSFCACVSSNRFFVQKILSECVRDESNLIDRVALSVCSVIWIGFSFDFSVQQNIFRHMQITSDITESLFSDLVATHFIRSRQKSATQKKKWVSMSILLFTITIRFHLLSSIE